MIKLASLLGGLCLIYGLIVTHYQTVFCPNTTLSGLTIAGKTIAQANTSLQQQLAKKTIRIVKKQQLIVQTTGQALHLKHDYTQQLKILKAQQNPWAWPLHLFKPSASKAAQPLPYQVSSTSLQSLNQAVLAKTKTKPVPISAPTIVKTKTGFAFSKNKTQAVLVPEKLTPLIQRQLQQGRTTINIQAAYQKPPASPKPPALTAALTRLNQLAQQKIVYQIFGKTVQIPKTTIMSWLTYQSNTIEIDRAAVTAYIQKLSDQFGTIDKTRAFKTHDGQVVQVPAGTYGWSLQIAQEAAILSQQLLNGTDFTRQPLTRGYNYNDQGIDIGDTYIEVSKSAQHLWYYQKGQVVLETPIVTGKPGQDTPIGVFVIWNKDRHTVLKGLNEDGSDYASPVEYWLPIDSTGIGIHDAPWQPQYGGTWYQTNGSHGCINTPPNIMAQLYDQVTTGTPVIVY
ncbi:L,D-transpeptidase family protein [Agrilactobacillus yilanensis]|uniref:L,D-transpeptidase family protein n=1 Tax=Agrilactobacillus yilanensis TaxID=2485997 RepID=A0ABW4J970_9LACO|nr:L,D-transpeptidase family protein [Agrilactobacillus yilanensis]